MMDLLVPSVDFVFKRIFGVEENRDVLLDFVNAVFESADEPGVTEVEILNPILDKTAAYDKQSILDIRARAADRTLINIEIQVRDEHDIEKRTLYYWSKLYGNQLAEGEIYRNLYRAVTINILKFNYINNNRYHNTFHLREDHSELILTNDIEIHIIELEKLRNMPIDRQQKLVDWTLFLLAPTQDKLEELAMKEPAIHKALTTLEFLSQDKEVRELYEARQRALRDWNSSISGAHEDGKAEGRIEGKAEGRIEGRVEGLIEGETRGKMESQSQIALRLLSMGMSIDMVAEATGLSTTQIEQLQHSQLQ